jgi:hypothetical protein
MYVSRQAFTRDGLPARVHTRESAFLAPEAVGDAPAIKLLFSAADYFA